MKKIGLALFFALTLFVGMFRPTHVVVHAATPQKYLVAEKESEQENEQEFEGADDSTQQVAPDDTTVSPVQTDTTQPGTAQIQTPQPATDTVQPSDTQATDSTTTNTSASGGNTNVGTTAPQTVTASENEGTENSALEQKIAEWRALPWPWLVTRASGLASYMLLVLIAITGILLTTGALYRIMSPALAWSLHRALGSLLLFSIGAHILGLLLDSFIKLRFVDVFIPFVSPFRPLLVALGIVGMYTMLLVLSTSLYTMTGHPKLWRTIHALSFPMFLLLFLHGILIGTDAHLPWVMIMYWSSASLVLLASLYRMIWRYRQPKKA